MVPTLDNNDWLIVSAINHDIEQGDIVISTQPNAFDEPIVKRVIAKGGQTVDIDFTAGKVYVDGVELDEPYIAAPTHAMEGNTFPMVVPEGKLFLMGDNRNDSTDSRSPMVGCVDERYILGVVKCRLMPNFTISNKTFGRIRWFGLFQRRVFNGRFSEANGSMVPRTYGENKEAYQRKSFQSGLRNRNT